MWQGRFPGWGVSGLIALALSLSGCTPETPQAARPVETDPHTAAEPVAQPGSRGDLPAVEAGQTVDEATPPASGGTENGEDAASQEGADDGQAEPAGEAGPAEASAGEAATPKAGAADAFGLADVEALARELAARPYEPGDDLPKAAADLSYDAFRRIQNTPESKLWADSPPGYQIHLDPRGYLFATEVKINIVGPDGVTAKPYAPDQFDFLDLPLDEDVTRALGFSGFRVLAPFNRSGKFDELISFRGASFFRALGAGTRYGASARGISLGTASSEGEEFPFFREFWLVRPRAGDRTFKIYALLDGESVTGAYAFEVEPGPDTKVDVKATLIPRRDLSNFGLSPLTSMYYFSPHDDLKSAVNDFRPAVHDSQGLSFRMSNGEWVWRPLKNPKELQVSVLARQAPLGFGLLQRNRDFEDYSDIEAAYHLRPGVWVEPGPGWGEGELSLVEIPTSNEYNDNIVVFWKPAGVWEKGRAHTVSYTMHWGLRPPVTSEVVAVAETRTGVSLNSKNQIFVIDFEAADEAIMQDVEAYVSSSSGKISNVNIKRHPETGLTRLSFELEPENAQSAELRALLTRSGKPVTETWIYRWRRQ